MSEKCALCGRPPWEGIGQFTATIAAAEERGRLAAAVVCKCGDELQPDDGAICGACLQPEIAEAEERGRRRGVEEAADAAEKYVPMISGPAALALAREIAIYLRARAALAPRAPHASEGPSCAYCAHAKWRHQYSSKEAFCSEPIGRGYCRCKNYLAPRDSAPVCNNCKRAQKASDGRTEASIEIGPCYCDTLRAPRDSGKGDAAFAEADALLAKDRK